MVEVYIRPLYGRLYSNMKQPGAISVSRHPVVPKCILLLK